MIRFIYSIIIASSLLNGCLSQTPVISETNTSTECQEQYEQMKTVEERVKNDYYKKQGVASLLITGVCIAGPNYPSIIALLLTPVFYYKSNNEIDNEFKIWQQNTCSKNAKQK